MSKAQDIPEELLKEVCKRNRIPAEDRFLVVKGLCDPGAPAACCGSDCVPCVLQVEAAVEEIRIRLGMG